MSLPPIRLPSPYGSDRLVQLAARLRPALCDTLITVGSQQFPAHSLVLAGVSQQLGRRGQWALGEGISPSTFAQLLHFVYGESVELQPGELRPLEEAARALGVQSLEEACWRARADRAKEPDPVLKKHQEEPEKPSRNPDRELGDPGEKQKPEQVSRTGGREQEMLHKHLPPRGSPEMAGATQEAQWEQTRSKEKRLQAPVGQKGADGKNGVLMWLRENPGGSEESLRELPGPLPPAGSLQNSVIPRPSWAEAPWLVGGQPALWSILLMPPGYGIPFYHSTPTTGAWQEVWRDQRIPLSLNAPKGLWSQNQLASSSPTPGSLPKGPAQLSPGEMEDSDQGHTGALATCAGHEDKAGCSSRPHPPPAPPARSRPYACSVCGKRFSLKHQMETHYRVHTGEKPFSCSLCPQRSRDFSAMTKHLRTHGAAPYRCPLCGAGCPSVASMQAHMRGHSPSQLPPGWTIRSTFLYSSSRPSRPSTSPCCPSSSTT
ncbi:zinc finger and BTB domain-containing protein 32 isoform X1 [Piliocolobus tephrosceles]|uniref:Zinc finger and BTB domain-containing protein 32 n=1 Tax=Piliocolobus tephrosceles TaxID=591936 RepID=A0A8C9GZE4_9PRIM|nr:zinc finger and BTB domain-containing protein 32 isoform X1 [Piliocolobus tephrosceles]XP_023052750.1 zinc finger and BTB domain-containing protein 32 isoform X1 [Piliocolobus tephrosceles]